jgi:hypothetical protein
MQKFSNTRKKWVKRNLWAICIVGVLLSIPTVSIAFDTDRNAAKNSDYSLYQPRTYYNATLFIVSNVYYVKHFDEEVIHLGYRLPFLPGIFHVKDENGTQEFTLTGGWAGSRVEIYGFDGFFKWQGLYTILMGKCTEISIIPVRGVAQSILSTCSFQD